MAFLNSDGQPAPAINAAQRVERDVTELLGLAKGIVCDGVVNAAEAEYFAKWAEARPEVITRWPVSLIFSRLQPFYRDGIIDDDEREELRDMLESLVGGKLSIILGHNTPTVLPLDNPPPLICWHKEVYVFTGKFAYGTRHHCECEVLNRGGSCDDNVTRRTTFLVLGTFSSRDWAQTSYGRKIEKAISLKQMGFPVRIVGEDHWANALSVTPV